MLGNLGIHKSVVDDMQPSHREGISVTVTWSNTPNKSVPEATNKCSMMISASRLGDGFAWSAKAFIFAFLARISGRFFLTSSSASRLRLSCLMLMLSL